jgi:hypothetical protein
VYDVGIKDPKNFSKDVYFGEALVNGHNNSNIFELPQTINKSLFTGLESTPSINGQRSNGTDILSKHSNTGPNGAR